MTHIYYDNETGDIIDALHDSCADIPTPNIIVTDEDWANVCRYKSRKIDLTTMTLTYDSSEPDKIAASKRVRDIDTQIAETEAKTYRPLREIQLGLDSEGTALEKLNEYNMQIEELRTERAKIGAGI